MALIALPLLYLSQDSIAILQYFNKLESYSNIAIYCNISINCNLLQYRSIKRRSDYDTIFLPQRAEREKKNLELLALLLTEKYQICAKRATTTILVEGWDQERGAPCC